MGKSGEGLESRGGCLVKVEEGLRTLRIGEDRRRAEEVQAKEEKYRKA